MTEREYVWKVVPGTPEEAPTPWLRRVRRYLSRGGATAHQALLADRKVLAEVRRSHPVEWPEDTGMTGPLSAQVNRLVTDLAAMSLRLEIAERVCVLYGWSSHAEETDRAKALAELWSAWAGIVGSKFTGPKAHPFMTDEWISAVAREHDERRAANRSKAALLLSGQVGP